MVAESVCLAFEIAEQGGSQNLIDPAILMWNDCIIWIWIWIGKRSVHVFLFILFSLVIITIWIYKEFMFESFYAWVLALREEFVLFGVYQPFNCPLLRFVFRQYGPIVSNWFDAFIVPLFVFNFIYAEILLRNCHLRLVKKSKVGLRVFIFGFKLIMFRTAEPDRSFFFPYFLTNIC